jgi:hypothetical protein
MKTQKCPPPMLETSMVDPLGGADEDPRASTTHVEDVDDDPPGGADEYLGAPTTYVEDVDGGPLGSC